VIETVDGGIGAGDDMTNIISGEESSEVSPFLDDGTFRLANGLVVGDPGFLSRLL
jgi:hypothetical protein